MICLSCFDQSILNDTSITLRSDRYKDFICFVCQRFTYMDKKQQKNTGRARVLRIALRAIVTALAIIWLAAVIDWKQVATSLISIDRRWVFASFALYILYVVPCAIRWQVAARSAGFSISFRSAMYWYFVGDFFNSFLPTGHGGDVVRAGMVSRRYGVSLGTVTGTVLMERIAGVVLAVGIFTAILPFAEHVAYKNELIRVSIVLTSVALCFFILVHIPVLRKLIINSAKKIPNDYSRRFVCDIISAMDICKKKWSPVVWIGLLSALNQGLMIGSAYLLSLGIAGFEADWYSYVLVVTLIFFAGLIPSIGGYGVSEAGYVVFFGWFGVGETPSAVFAVVKLLFDLSVALIGGLLFCIGFSNAKKGFLNEETSLYTRWRN